MDEDDDWYIYPRFKDETPWMKIRIILAYLAAVGEGLVISAIVLKKWPEAWDWVMRPAWALVKWLMKL